MHKKFKHSVIALPLATLLLASLSACGGASDAEQPASAADGKLEATEITVGISPVVDHAAVQVGVEQGFFEAEGLTVIPKTTQGGSAALPAMISGDFQAVYASYPSFFIAESQGLGITLVAEAVRGTEETGGIYVQADSQIREPKDLEGATLAINTFRNVGDATIRASLSELGVDTAKIEMVELGFPDMPAALEKGNVDAVWVVEPFRTILDNNGARKIHAPYSGTADGIPVAGVGMTDEFAAQNPDTVAAFTRAMEKSNALLAEDPDIARKTVLSYTQIDPKIASEMELPQWTAGELNAQEVGRWNDILVATGLMESSVEMSELLPQTK
jgi:ABC-type nitrate/sulfonate/bicarbonate transport system substrate-binding protein